MKLPIDVADYRLVEEVGSGSFGNVYRAEVRGEFGFSQDVAVKLVDPVRAASRPELISSLADEGLLLSGIQHPNIVRVRQLTKGHQPILGDVFLLVMELVRGPRIKEVNRILLTSGLRMPMEAVIFLLTEAADALHYAHNFRAPNGERLRLVHRDLKPENLMLDETGRLKILDFGIAWASQRRVDSTETGMTKGTVLFMSPEQLSGEPLDGRSDLYSLGLVAWEMVCGEHMVPLPKRGLADIPGVILNMDRTRVEERLHRLRGALRASDSYGFDDQRANLIEDLFVRMLAREPKDRFADAGALLERLEHLGEIWRPRLGRRYLRKVSAVLARASLPDSGDTVADANPKVSSDEIELVTMHTRALMDGEAADGDSLASGHGYSPFAPTVADAPLSAEEEAPTRLLPRRAPAEEASVGDDLVPVGESGFDPEETPVLTPRPRSVRRSSGSVERLVPEAKEPAPPPPAPPPELLDDDDPSDVAPSAAVSAHQLPGSVEQSVVGATRLLPTPEPGRSKRFRAAVADSVDWLQELHPAVLFGGAGLWLAACLLLVGTALSLGPATPEATDGVVELVEPLPPPPLEPTVEPTPQPAPEPTPQPTPAGADGSTPEVAESAPEDATGSLEEVVGEAGPTASLEPTPSPTPRPWKPRISGHTPPESMLLLNPVDFSLRAHECSPRLYIAPEGGKFKLQTMERGSGGRWSASFTPPYEEAWQTGLLYYVKCCRRGQCRPVFRSRSRPQRVPNRG